MRGLLFRVLSWQWVIAFIILSTCNAWSYPESDCVRCHKEGSCESRLQIDIDRYRSSVHGSEIGCSGCHRGVGDDRHITMRGSGKVDCQQCHEQQHLHSKDGSVACASCHTKHYIYGAEDRRSSVYWENLGTTCKVCHPTETENPRTLSFLPSLHIASHPKQNFAKIFDKRMCVGCHQGKAAHGEDVPINSQDCYRCHIPLAEKRAVLGYIHTDADWYSQPVNTVAAYISLIALIGFILILLNVFRGSKRNGQNKT